ncbi:hypothetical protein VNO78_31017 [Psophocarpus tetragonolobus]|uniref:Leucine-rich repeat-containing N-terminal plant-type domain-containing protein n=1 Tax=Psophocarpus tetragonolobus TaxID=3891 RepID=A0AAN9RYG1_PSOTE
MGWFLFIVLSLLAFHFPSEIYSLVPLCNHDDASALLSFKTSFSLEEHFFADGSCESYSAKTESWKNGTNCCLWEGVSCDTKSGHVIELDLWLQWPSSLSTFDLSYNNLLSLTSNDGGRYTFSDLEYLNLSSCNINTFPNFFSGLKILRSLDLSRNQIHGKIPKWFNRMGKDTLSSLDLSHNLLTSVKYLSLSWTNLGYIDLSFNMLEGDIPVLPFSIVFFSVSNNRLTGHISSAIFLDMQGDNFSGSIPKTYLEIETLETMNLNGVLDLGGNNMQDTFPIWLESLENLEVLVLRSNRFNGIVNCFKLNNSFPMLRVFDISNNNFSGKFPTTCIKNLKGMTVNVNNGLQYMKAEKHSSRYYDSVVVTIKGNTLELERILTTFITIDLSNNRFEGAIPTFIGELKSLKGLNLSHNRITGVIPQTVGSLNNLEWLDLSSNMLMGEIPNASTNLHFLSVLNLSQNQLVRMIPKGNQFDTFQSNSYQDNQGLCGWPLSKSCHMDKNQSTNSTTFEHNEQFGFGWKPIAIGYASGRVFGILLGYVIFFILKPEWSIRFLEGILNQRLSRKRRSRS